MKNFDLNLLQKMHISTEVTKLNGNKNDFEGIFNIIPCFNLPVGITCREDCTCRDKCYAKRGNFRFENVKRSLMNNLKAWRELPHEIFEMKIISFAQMSKFFRWHSSGDIPDEEYVDSMYKIADSCRKTRFLCFTKKDELVNEYISKYGKPKNLQILLSAWGDFIPDNPHNLPMAYIRLKSGEGADKIPKTAYECPGNCATCTLKRKHCWNLKPGEAVVFNQH